MPTVLVVLAGTACVTTVLNAMGKCPAWVPLAALSVFALIQVLPVGK
jgi:hypothetical protein